MVRQFGLDHDVFGLTHESGNTAYFGQNLNSLDLLVGLDFALSK